VIRIIHQATKKFLNLLVSAKNKFRHFSGTADRLLIHLNPVASVVFGRVQRIVCMNKKVINPFVA
jgi:hypothetical protein